MLRSIVSSIEFEKFRRNWSEKRGREPVHYEICERFAPIFLRRTHVNIM
ncbi:hypothetical protein MAL08_12445 [Leptospira noguchii]|nr:hypothetical protein [Leptospira noguchii]UOG36905.1 hypothetical protein MAL08_12445 [Leptospira noguchii]